MMQGLLSHPALWLTLTIVAYLIADRVFRKLGSLPLAHPVLGSIALLIPLLKLCEVSYAQYFQGARFIHFLLGPATVALAIPLYSNLPRVRQMFGPLLIALTVGGTTGIVSVLVLGRLFGLSSTVLLSFAPKSVTTPIAMALAEKMGGNASIAAVAVVVTGVVGAMMVSHVLKPFKIKDDAVTGFALGLSSHGAGTAYAFLISAEAGAFSGLAMGLNGVFTSLALPLGAALWHWF